MNVPELIKSGLLQGYASSDIGIGTAAVCMLITAVVSAYVFAVYRVVTRNSFYNKNFNISLVAMAIITAAIILTIQENIVISLGMVGALSIVRFRTAIKDPLDLVFLFWSISIGIICGAGFGMIAAITSIVLTIAIFLFEKISTGCSPLILVVNAADYRDEEQIMEIVGKHCSLCRVRARNITKAKINMAIEVRVKPDDRERVLIDELMGMDGILSASLVGHDGDVTY